MWRVIVKDIKSKRKLLDMPFSDLGCARVTGADQSRHGKTAMLLDENDMPVALYIEGKEVIE